MGNIGSQTGHISHRTPPEEQWTQSFPRTQSSRLNHQHMVLPERDARQKLRPTNNGEILHSGGTLTGRQNRPPTEKNNQYPLHAYREHSPTVKSYFSNERDPLHKSSRPQGLPHRHNQNATSQKTLQDQMKLFVSEPDLRYSSPIVQDAKEKRSKKKYKAPPPPQNFRMNDKLEWEENSSDNDFPARKTRLFKTRAETKKTSSHVNKLSNVEYNENVDSSPKLQPLANLRPNRLSLPELKLADSDEFQKELKEATKRLRHIQIENKNTIKYEPSDISQMTNKDKLKTLDHNISNVMNNKENVRKKIKEMVELDDNKNIINYVRGEASGKESSTPDTSPNLIMKDIKGKEQPKTFYFGMDEPVKHSEVDHFASNLHQVKNISHSSESDISSDMDSDENNVTKIGIDLQLRPILPKKQLEIPRFSPAVAWKLLSSMDTNDTIATTTVSDDLPVFIEERIEKYSRPPPPSVQIGPRSSNDKSGDSGISGDDAIPTACYEDTPETGIIIPGAPPYANKQERVSWTPQQDLGDDSSLEECTNKPTVQTSKSAHSGPHLFSLSLPRENQLAAYMIEKTNTQYSGLEKLRKSVSGVLSNLSSKKDFVPANLTDEESVNWFLSKSAPNSLSNGFHSLEVRKSQDSEQMYPPGGNTTSRVMYLPEIEDGISRNKVAYTREEERMRSSDHLRKRHNLSIYSKSCEDITTEIKAMPEILKDSSASDEFRWKSGRKPKKFTFQSTIRQIEKKRLSDKLSREAERREKKRLRELEAMQKVEEEFQKKRAREKANIRQQLRLYCMDEDPAWSSLPPNLEIKDEIRPEPDGALSSSTTSSSPLPVIKSNDKKHFQKFKNSDIKTTECKVRASATQELSEYRQIQRDYKEYRTSAKYTSDGRYPKQTTVHPQVTCNMPKAKGTKAGGSNYRKDFACGVKSTMSAESTYSEDSQNNSQMYHNKYAPITRF